MRSALSLLTTTVVGFASLLSSTAPACSKKDSPQFDSPPPTPVPVTSATTPPIWVAPDPGGPLPTPTPAGSAAPANPDLAKARTLATAGDHKKVRALLEKKVKAGKATSEEAAILMSSCLQLRDKACTDMVKSKHPELETPPPPPG